MKWIVAPAVALFIVGFGAALHSETALSGLMVVHATLMITAWGILLPGGAIIARYFKVTPYQNFPDEVENLFWWDWHRILQYSGLALGTVAVLLALAESGGRIQTWHGVCGLVVMTGGWAQVASTWFRGNKGGPTDKAADPADPVTWRGDHYDMTRRRRLFEAWHKRAGWAVLILAGLTILLGIAQVGAPAWLLASAGALQAAALCGVLDGRLRGRWVSTYHALWGPDPHHPGNRALLAPPSPPRRWQSRR